MTTLLTPRLYLREMADDDLDDMAALLGDSEVMRGLTVQRVDDVDEVEIGYHVRAGLQGKGLATEAAAACRDYARETLEIDRLIAIINPANVPSRRVVERSARTWRRGPPLGAAGSTSN